MWYTVARYLFYSPISLVIPFRNFADYKMADSKSSLLKLVKDEILTNVSSDWCIAFVPVVPLLHSASNCQCFPFSGKDSHAPFTIVLYPPNIIIISPLPTVPYMLIVSSPATTTYAPFWIFTVPLGFHHLNSGNWCNSVTGALQRWMVYSSCRPCSAAYYLHLLPYVGSDWARHHSCGGYREVPYSSDWVRSHLPRPAHCHGALRVCVDLWTALSVLSWGSPMKCVSWWLPCRMRISFATISLPRDAPNTGPSTSFSWMVKFLKRKKEGKRKEER